MNKSKTTAEFGSWRIDHGLAMDSDVEKDGTYVFWNDDMAIRASIFMATPNDPKNRTCLLDAAELGDGYKPFDLHDKLVRARIEHSLQEEDGKALYMTSLFCTFGFELVQISIFYSNPELRDRAITIARNVTMTTELATAAAADFHTTNNAEIFDTIFEMNKHAKSKSKHLAQTLYLDMGGTWDLIFPFTPDDDHKIRFWNHINYIIQRKGISQLIVFSDMTQTDVSTGKKTHALTLHHIQRGGQPTAQQCVYTKKLFRAPTFGEVQTLSCDDMYLPYWLEPIHAILKT